MISHDPDEPINLGSGRPLRLRGIVRISRSGPSWNIHSTRICHWYTILLQETHKRTHVVLQVVEDVQVAAVSTGEHNAAKKPERNQFQGWIRTGCVLQLVWRDETRSNWVAGGHPER